MLNGSILRTLLENNISIGRAGRQILLLLLSSGFLFENFESSRNCHFCIA